MLEIGLMHREDSLVTNDMLALNVHSGGLSVFATPSMIALMEKTAHTLLQKHLDEGFTSVGVKVDISHISPSCEGARVYSLCEVIDILKDGRLVKFKVSAFDEFGLIGEGFHDRAIVKTDKFMAKLEEKFTSQK